MTAHMIWTLSTLPSAASALQGSISALEKDIAALESQSSGLEPWLGRYTLLVAIGVTLEIFVVIFDHRKEVGEWLFCELIPEGPSRKKLGIEIASIILVIIGVMGEFGIGLWISHINGILRSKNGELRAASDQLVALVTSDAEEAKRQANAADLARVQLEASMEWRKLSKEQERKLCSELGPKLAKKYHVNAFVGDMETTLYAFSIGEALDRCEIAGGLKPSINPPHVGGVGYLQYTTPLWGVWITYDPSPAPVPPLPPSPTGFGIIRKAEAIALREKLESSGIKVVGITSDPKGVLPLGVIYVGPRPPPNSVHFAAPAVPQATMIQ